MNKIILASSSPRRIELLKDAGFDTIIVPSNIEETVSENLSPEETVKELARQKSLHVKSMLLKKEGDEIIPLFKCLSGDIPIVAADTIVYLDGIIGKPKDREDALNILMNLSGKEHAVFTGVSILSLMTEKELSFAEKTKVYFKEYTEEDLYEYLASDEPYDKAGAYAIQGYFSRYIDHIEGDYNNVMGLPLKSLCSAISDF